MAAPMYLASWFCRRVFRLDLTCILWIIFAISLASVIVMYLRIMHITRVSNFRSLSGDIQDDGFYDDEEKEEADQMNLILDDLSDTTHIGIEGWWMPHVKWSHDVNCDIDHFGICKRVLSVSCKPESVRAIYQYLPIVNNILLKGITFSVKSAAIEMKMFEGMEVTSMYSAIALIKYSSGGNDIIRLDFPGGTHTYLEAEHNIMFSENKQPVSITVMLGCYGYTGIVKFLAVVVRPIVADTFFKNGFQRRNYVPACPPLSSSSEIEHNFVTETVLNSGAAMDKDDITMVTQISMDRIDTLNKIVASWDGPMSIVLYVPTKSETLDTDHEWKRLYIQKKLKTAQFSPHTVITAVYANTVYDVYPINYLRNLAIKNSRTSYMLLLDADFIPSSKLRDKFTAHIKTWNNDQTAFIVPAFEFMEGLEELPHIPETKDELHSQIFGNVPNVLPFHILYCSAHLPYRGIKTDRTPMYDERFTGYGMNKVTHTMELLAAGSTPDTQKFLQDPFRRLENRNTRFEFVADIMNKYNIGPCHQR
uniref:Uncharacterized protein LOC102804782 n=1 Tax=Saccoglossus kowalevskii TaxID=10224 RepID=A0ABM0MFU0_SACKO|nr:PREDICTED: uncharacterized protein LOC102804782 [Saccoglossus kowalevskii]